MRLFFLALSLACTALLCPVVDAQVENPPSISTSGDSIVYVMPDEVIVNFGIETFDPDLDKAKSANDERAAHLVKAVKGIGVEPQHIQTDKLQVEISYKDSSQRWAGIAGYFARRSYSVTLKDPKLFENLVDAALKNGANQIAGFTFHSTEIRKYRDQARVMAAHAAKEKAELLARELGSTVGRPRTISESYDGYYGGLQSQQMGQNSVQFAAIPSGEEIGTMPLGQIAVRAQVSVTFDLKP
jgi:uncharacterized protein